MSIGLALAAAGSLLLLALAAAGSCCWRLLLAPAACSCCTAGAALVWFCCSFDGFLLPRSSSSSPLPLPLFDSCAKLFPFLFFSFLFLFFIPFSSVLTPPHIQAASQFAPSHTGAGSNLHDSTLGHSTVSRSPLPTQSEGCPFPRCNGEFQVFFFSSFPFFLLVPLSSSSVQMYVYRYTKQELPVPAFLLLLFFFSQKGLGNVRPHLFASHRSLSDCPRYYSFRKIVLNKSKDGSTMPILMDGKHQHDGDGSSDDASDDESDDDSDSVRHYKIIFTLASTESS